MRKLKLIAALGLAISTLLFPHQVAAKPITINWWHASAGAQGEVVKSIIQQFNTSQDSFVVVGTFKGSYDETVNAGITAIRVGKQPHILQAMEVSTLTLMLSDAFYPVYQLMDDMGHKVNWGNYLQPALSIYMNADGNLMSMPFIAYTPVMYYNVDLFKKIGIAPLSKVKPIAWDKLGEICAKLVKSGVSGGMVTAWQSWIQIENYSAIHNLPFATKANGFEGLDSELTINNDKLVHHIARLKSWLKDKRFAYVGQKYQSPRSEFIAQRAGVYMDSISAIANLQKDIKNFNWDTAPLPVESWMKTPVNSIIGGASNWVLKGHSKEAYKGVVAFLEFLATDDIQKFWYKKTGYLPITLTAYQELRSKGYFKRHPRQEVGIRQIIRHLPTKNSRGLRLGYIIQISNIINEELGFVWRGKKTAREALDSMVKRGNAKLRKFAENYK